MSTIYGLKERGSCEIRYVGLTRLPLKQALANHLKKARANWRYGPAPWIASGVDVEIVRLRTCPADQERAAERQWVQRIHARGDRLFNSHLVPRSTGAAA